MWPIKNKVRDKLRTVKTQRGNRIKIGKIWEEIEIATLITRKL